MARRKACSCDSAFAGSGRFSDYRKDGSWIMNQIEKGYDQVRRGISVDTTGERIRFSSRDMRIASSAADGFSDEITIRRSCMVVPCDSKECVRVSMNFRICGSLGDSSLEELGMMRELVCSRLYSVEREYSAMFGFKFESVDPARVDFDEKCVYVNAVGVFPARVDMTADGIAKYLKSNGWEVFDPNAKGCSDCGRNEPAEEAMTEEPEELDDELGELGGQMLDDEEDGDEDEEDEDGDEDDEDGK